MAIQTIHDAITMLVARTTIAPMSLPFDTRVSLQYAAMTPLRNGQSVQKPFSFCALALMWVVHARRYCSTR